MPKIEMNMIESDVQMSYFLVKGIIYELLSHVWVLLAPFPQLSQVGLSMLFLISDRVNSKSSMIKDGMTSLGTVDLSDWSIDR